MKEMIMNILNKETEQIKQKAEDDLDRGRSELINQIRQSKTVVSAFPEDLDIDFDALIEKAEDTETVEEVKEVTDELHDKLADKVGR